MKILGTIISIIGFSTVIAYSEGAVNGFGCLLGWALVVVGIAVCFSKEVKEEL